MSELEALSSSKKHLRVTLLALVLRLRILVAASMWTEVSAALQRIEAAMGLAYEPATSTPRPRKPAADANPDISPAKNEKERLEDNFITYTDAFDAAMAVHYLVMAVVYYTHIGLAVEAAPRLSHLHAVLDSGCLDLFPEGIIEVRLPLSCAYRPH